MTSGYLHRTYAEAFRDHGSVHLLPESGGWLLRRPIAGTGHEDAMGAYPLMSCRHWPALARDLECLGEGVVAVSAVTDPFGGYSRSDLHHAFEFVRAYKEHYVVDLTAPLDERTTRHHRRELRRAARRVGTEVSTEPVARVAEWTAVYRGLIERRGIRGPAAFSRRSLEHQLTVPGRVALHAEGDGELAGVALWYVMADVAYYHLAACTETGYRSGAAYALLGRALDYFASQGILHANLGAGAGAEGNVEDGLSRFKRGWSTGTRTAYFCGRVLDRRAYDRLTIRAGASNSSYFPQYRTGEWN